jgi:tetratricopeptide (TPR) repeat protein
MSASLGIQFESSGDRFEPAHGPDPQDSYVGSCFEVEFDELHESRDYRQIPELQRVAELGNRDEIGAALDLLRSVAERYPDYDFIYGWRAILLSKSGHLEGARAAIHEGLARSRSKYALCEDMGNIEFEWGNLAEAVKWWIKSIALQKRATATDSWHSYVYLAGVAAALGEEPASSTLLEAVDRQWPEKVRLNGQGRGRVALRVASEGNASMRRAIQRLCEDPEFDSLWQAD